MTFYNDPLLSVLNDKVKLEHKNPSIGIIICKDKDRTIVEYSLQTATLPIGVATYNTAAKLPLAYKSVLPSPETISKKLIQFFKQINENNTKIINRQ
jgi:hypothetical protein